MEKLRVLLIFQRRIPSVEGVYFVKAIAETNFGETLSKQQFVQVFE